MWVILHELGLIFPIPNPNVEQQDMLYSPNMVCFVAVTYFHTLPVHSSPRLSLVSVLASLEQSLVSRAEAPILPLSLGLAACLSYSCPGSFHLCDSYYNIFLVFVNMINKYTIFF